MKSFLILQNIQTEELPPQFIGDDVRYSMELVSYFIEEYTQPDDIVFDPFAGFGTTLIAAESMNRKGYGIEYDISRVEYSRAAMNFPKRLLHGDSRRLNDYALPDIDLSITSPPFMNKNDGENPFTNYEEQGEGYSQYLIDIQSIYQQIERRMKPGARAVVEASNLKSDQDVTLLAWDIARVIGKVIPFEREIVIGWEPGYGYGYEHSYALIFQKQVNSPYPLSFSTSA